jgi:FixJ family two-component response regulator
MILNTIRLHVVDSDPCVHQALRTLARSTRARLEFHSTGAEFLEAYSPDVPGCLAIDVTTLGSREFAALDVLNSRHESIAVVALSGNATVSLAVRALKAGAIDFIAKPCGIVDLVDAVQRALSIAKHLYDRRCERGEFERRLGELSTRQREILHHIVLGKANKLIAYELGISERTVEVHRYRLLQRMAVGSAVELARLVGAFQSELQNDGPRGVWRCDHGEGSDSGAVARMTGRDSAPAAAHVA